MSREGWKLQREKAGEIGETLGKRRANYGSEELRSIINWRMRRKLAYL